MRVISQDGTIDIPYDYFSLTIASGRYEDVEVSCIFCHNLSSPLGTKLAEYSSKEKAQKVMEMLRDAYIGMPIVTQNVDVSEDVSMEFEILKKRSIVVQTENQPSKVECISNAIFQFPTDEELE